MDAHINLYINLIDFITLRLSFVVHIVFTLVFRKFHVDGVRLVVVEYFCICENFDAGAWGELVERVTHLKH